MSKKRKILLYYCLLLSLFIPASSFFSNRTLGGAIPALLFLPVAGYLIYSIKQAGAAEESKGKKGSYFTIFTVLALLTAIGVYNSLRPNPHLQGAQIDDTHLQGAPKAEAPVRVDLLPGVPKVLLEGESEKPSLGKIQVVAEVRGGTVNIRKSPTSSSELITTVEDGSSFEYLEKSSGWYKIVLSEKETGWIKGNYVEEIKE